MQTQLLDRVQTQLLDRVWPRANRVDAIAGSLLRLMALLYSTRPSLRALLKGKDGWFEFGVGLTTETGSVARSIHFRGGRVRARTGLEGVDVTLRFRTDQALLSMLRATPDELMGLILRNELVAVGNWTWLQLFNHLMSRLVGGMQQRRLAAKGESSTLPGTPRDTPPTAPLGTLSSPHPPKRPPQRPRPPLLRGAPTDPGVLHLADPYLSEFDLSDFPTLARFLHDHLTTAPEVCAERAVALTDWYRLHGFATRTSGEAWHPVERQGRAFQHLMTHKSPVLRPGDLLPGSTTSMPTAGSLVFPDAQGTLIWGELDTIADRALIPFRLPKETADTLHHDVFGWWAPHTFRQWARDRHGDPLCAQVDERWVGYFVWKSVGISHTIPDFQSVLHKGTSGVICDIRAALERAPDDEARVTFQAMIRCLEGVEAYADSLAAKAENSTLTENRKLAEICSQVPRQPARTLHEAVTSVWLLWVALHNENTDTGLSFGRLDQLWQPYFDADMAACTTEAERAACVHHSVAVCGAFFLRCADHFPLSPDIGNTLFGGASSTQALTLGGVTPDGADAVNDMSYVLLKVTELLAIRDVNVNARYKVGVSSETWLRRLCEVNVITAGTPALHGDDAVFAALKPHGYTLADIRNWSATGCVEPTITGKHMAHTGSVLFNLVAPLEMALHDGWHPLMELQAGPHTGPVSDFATFEDFFSAYADQLRALIGLAVQRNNQLAAVHADLRPTPLLSALMGGTLRSGRDVTRGGAEHNTSGTSNIGLADVTDSLLVIEALVYERRALGLPELVAALDADHDDPLAKLLKRRPVARFGSGDPHAVAMADRVAALVHETWAGHQNHRGGCYTSGFWSMSQHVAYGNLSGALPSGRRAHKAFTPGLTPSPKASKTFLDNIADVARLSPENLDNNVAFNVKLVPSAKADREETVAAMAAYVKTYFELGGMQIQFNVVTADTLRDAVANPDDYRGLLVRISGYNAYFVTLNPEIQLELIERAEFGL